MSIHGNCIFIQHFEKGCRLLHMNNDQPQAALVDLYNIPRCGDIFKGRIVRLDPAYAWIDIGNGRPALLKRRKQVLCEGEPVTVRVTREASRMPFEEKGVQVVLETSFRAEPSNPKTPCCLKHTLPDWLKYLVSISSPDMPRIYMDAPELLRQARDCLPQFHDKLQLNRQACDNAALVLIWQEILDTVHPLKDGGNILIEETSAATIIDVNTSAFYLHDSARSLAHERDRLQFNQRAADIIFKLIYLRQISGAVFIDFPRLNKASSDHRFLLYLKDKSQMIPGLKISGFTRSGLLEISRPVTGPGLKAKASMLGIDL